MKKPAHKQILQIKKFKNDLKKNSLLNSYVDSKNIYRFIKKLIYYGSGLDELFSLGRGSDWNADVVEEIIHTYEIWKLRLLSLLRSKYGKKLELGIMYPVLKENDGVSGLSGASFNLDTQVINKGLRTGIKYNGIEYYIADEESVRQFEGANNSLKKRVNSLSDILKTLDNNKTTTEKQKKNETKVFPHKILRGARWENITLQFLDEETVYIQAFGYAGKIGYADMGFIDKRTKKPNQQWILLLILAKNKGELGPASKDANAKYKKQKQLLSDRLEEYFVGMQDPFRSYYDKDYGKDGYKIKIRLIPPLKYKDETGEATSTSEQVAEIFNKYSGG